jgi:SLT domain-containing protein
MTAPEDASQTSSTDLMRGAMLRTERSMQRDVQDPWANSEHRWLMQLPSRRKGKAGEMIVQEWFSSLGMNVHKAANTGSDRTVNGHRVEIKTSTLWEAGKLIWQQIRDQEYSHIILLGIEPDRVRLWCVPKEVLRAHAVGQHTGAKGVETMWLSVNAESVPEWLAPYGGDLSTAGVVSLAAFKPAQ